MSHRGTSISWRNRALAAACYLGGLPFLWRSIARRGDDFPRRHAGQAAITFLMLFAVFGAFSVSIAVLSYALIFHRDVYEGVHLERHLLTLVRRMTLCWMVFWAFGLALALLGSSREVLLVTRLAGNARLTALGVVLLAAVYLLAACAAPFAIHASSLTRSDAAPGDAYFIYEDLGKVPRWVFTLGFYRISLAAKERWGPGRVVALRLSEEAILRSRAEGRFVFLATHGKADGLLCDGKFVTPEDVSAMPAGEDLAFVYLTGCDSGTQEQAWTGAFAPAKVVTYPRLTAIVEHAWWMWFEGPKIVRAL